MSQVEEIPTQQVDRFDNNTSLEPENDFSADVLCILHPTSKLAHEAVDQIDNGEKVITNSQEDSDENDSDKENDSDGEDSDKENTKVSKSCPPGAPHTNTTDIVLRLSARPKNPLLGFCFGRNTNHNDCVLSDPNNWISNKHFRIYINEHSTIMIEDVSRNGTFLDGKLLSAAQKVQGKPYKHTLVHGAEIRLANPDTTESVQFIVKIPKREGELEDLYEDNVNKYFARLNALHLDRDRAANHSPPVLWPHATSEPTQSIPSPNISKRSSRPWNGGGKYNMGKKIGQGAFASVYRITDKFDGKPFAAKEIDRRNFVRDGRLDMTVSKELKIMSRIHHDNVVQFIECMHSDEYVYLIMEMIPGGDLSQMIHAAPAGRLREDQVRDMTVQLLSALEYLHRCGITHRDIKPDNIMLSNHDPIRVKLTDFGLSKMVEEDGNSMLRTFCGTILYCAPEVYSEFNYYDRDGSYHPDRGCKDIPRDYSNSCDLWSLAGVLFYAVSGAPPFPVDGERFHYTKLLHIIMTSALDIRPLQVLDLSENCIKFLKAMLQKWPEQRPSIEKLQAHKWITGLPSTQVTNEDDDDDLDSDQEGTEYVSTEPLPTEVITRSTSDLALHNRVDSENYDDLDELDRSNLRLSLQRSYELPSSVNSSGSSAGDNFAFMRNGPGHERLFGELGSSALGSSGAIPDGHLNLPLTSWGNAHPQMESSNFSDQSANDSIIHPLFRNAEGASEHPEFSEDFDYRNSLMGAESVFGQMQVRSPSAAPSPQNETTDSPEAQSPDGHDNIPPTQSYVTAPSTSMRRQREDTEGTGDDEPATKRHKIFQADDMPIEKNYFWDARDMTTWHDDYPTLTFGQLAVLKAEAAAQGKEYKPPRTTSKPNYSHTGRSQDCISPTPSMKSADKDGTFRVPRRILAKLVGEPGTAHPLIVINITEQFTSWGRAPENTQVFRDRNEDRIGKYALKLILWSPGMNHDEPLKAPDSSFYISTKARNGIRVNNVRISSFEWENDRGESQYWVQLKHGDIISVFERPRQPEDSKSEHLTQTIKLRFQCFFGASKNPRSPDEPVSFVPEGKERADLEAIVLRRDNEFRAHQRDTAAETSKSLPFQQKPVVTAKQREVRSGASAAAANPSRSVLKPRGPLERVRRESGVSTSNLPPTLNGLDNNLRQSLSVPKTVDSLNGTKSTHATTVTKASSVTGGTPSQSTSVFRHAFQTKDKDNNGNTASKSHKPRQPTRSAVSSTKTSVLAAKGYDAKQSISTSRGSARNRVDQSIAASEASTEHS